MTGAPAPKDIDEPIRPGAEFRPEPLLNPADPGLFPKSNYFPTVQIRDYACF